MIEDKKNKKVYNYTQTDMAGLEELRKKGECENALHEELLAIRILSRDRIYLGTVFLCAECQKISAVDLVPKSKKITFLLTEQEKMFLQLKAEEQKITLSEFIRQKLFGC